MRLSIGEWSFSSCARMVTEQDTSDISRSLLSLVVITLLMSKHYKSFPAKHKNIRIS